jgi:hypothetical protein
LFLLTLGFTIVSRSGALQVCSNTDHWIVSQTRNADSELGIHVWDLQITVMLFNETFNRVLMLHKVILTHTILYQVYLYSLTHLGPWIHCEISPNHFCLPLTYLINFPFTSKVITDAVWFISIMLIFILYWDLTWLLSLCYLFTFIWANHISFTLYLIDFLFAYF